MHPAQITPDQRWLYAGLCVLLPVLWGLLMVGASNLLERALRHRRSQSPLRGPVRESEILEYHI